MGVVVLVSLLAAGCFGVASVLQHDGARRVRRRAPLHPGLVADLVRKPGWLLGIGAQVVGVALHLCAVNLGPLSLVQPVLAVGLVIALAVQRLSGRRVSRRAMFAAGLVVLGLAVFLAVQPPQVLDAPADAQRWLPGLLLAGVLLGGTLVVGLRSRDGLRGICLGAAAGTLMATSAAMGKAWGALLMAGGPPAVLTGWQLWAAVTCGLGGALLSQAAFQAAPLGGSLAAMMAIDPVVGVGLGVVVYGESFATPVSWAPRCLGLLFTLVGVVLLAWSQREDPRRPRPTLPLLVGDGTTARG
ncbi:MAG: DMT family transporter [Actinomycetota bacterium]|nr:DMT family transporter [Pseudonocardiales bacterium]MDQ2709355.1 DMT family transporter [Actinomycetota bacterium]